MKKLLFMLLSVFFVLGLACGCSVTSGIPSESLEDTDTQPSESISDTTSTEHAHDWQWTTTLEPTYRNAGLQVGKCSCGAEKEEEIAALGINKKGEALLESKTIKILAIGNSLTDDSCQYLHDILHGLGFTDVTIGKAWIGGSTISDHAVNMKFDNAKYTWEYFNEQSGRWVVDGVKRPLSYCVDFAEWDYVTLQNSGWGMAMSEHMDPVSLNYAVDYVVQETEDAIPLWYMTPAYRVPTIQNYLGPNATQLYHFEQGVKMVQERVLPIKAYMGVIPTLASMQNFRTAYGDRITNRDDVHMSYPVGCVISGVAWAMTFVPQADLDSLTLDYVSDIILQDIKTSVKSAIENPWGITELNSTAGTIEGFRTTSGGYATLENGYQSITGNALMVKETNTFNKGSITFDVKTAIDGWNGAVFGLTYNTENFWEVGADYYFAGISETGKAMLVKVNGTGSTVWTVLSQTAISNYDTNAQYSVKILTDGQGHIALYINNELIINYLDKTPFTGNNYGLRAEHRGAQFTNFTITQDENVVMPELTVYEEIEGYKFVKGNFVATANGIASADSMAIIESTTAFASGTVTYDYTAKEAADSGFVFGLTNANNLSSYWENSGVSYYIAMITTNGYVGIGAVNRAGKVWTWVTEPANVKLSNYSVNNTYKVKLCWDSANGGIYMYVNGELKVSYTDTNKLTGTICGFRAGAKGNTFENVTFSSEISKPTISVNSGSAKLIDIDGTPAIQTTANKSTIMLTAKTITSTSVIEFDYKVVGYQGSMCGGIILASNNPNVIYTNSTDYYYLIGKMKSGKIGGMYVNGGKYAWTTAGTIDGEALMAMSASEDKTYRIKVECDMENETYKFYVDGVLGRTIKFDLGFKGGYIGFTNGASGTTTVSNIVIDGEPYVLQI